MMHEIVIFSKLFVKFKALSRLGSLYKYHTLPKLTFFQSVNYVLHFNLLIDHAFYVVVEIKFYRFHVDCHGASKNSPD